MSYISAEKNRDEIFVWERTPKGRRFYTAPAPYYFYVKDPKGTYKSMYGDKLSRQDYTHSREFNFEKAKLKASGHELFESDIPAEIKYLSKYYYNKEAPDLHITMHDIEVDYDPEVGHAGTSNPYAPINSVALIHLWKKECVVFAIPPNKAKRSPNNDEWKAGPAPASFLKELNDIAELPEGVTLKVTFCENEEELLIRYLREIQDSDVLCGWNSEMFDHPYIAKRAEKLGQKYFRQLSFKEARSPTYRWIMKYDKEEEVVDFGGRIGADYMELFRKYEMAERPSYKLENIADEMLPHLPKLEYDGSLATLYRRNFAWFVRYNIRDTEILEGLEDRLGYMDLANKMMHLSTGVWKNVVGTLKLAEYAVVNYCHNELDNLIVNDFHRSEDKHKIQGAFVLLPQIGEHEHTGSIDLNSLYPSSIRAINISPETLMGQFEETVNAIEEIAKGTDTMLTCTFDYATQVPHKLRGRTVRRPASQFRDDFIKLKWAVSGYGTIFSQQKQGVIPKILEDWYATRKKYQAMARNETDKIKRAYYDKLQYTYKIKLNAFYGALTNQFFRFFDLRMGESTTGTGRMILLHQCAKTCELLSETGEYMMPDRYETEVDKKTGKVKEHFGYSNKWPVVYGDSVAGNTIIETPDGEKKIEELFNSVDYRRGTKEYSNSTDHALTFVPESQDNEFRPIKYVVRHKVNKKMYRVWLGNTRYLEVTEDHSLIGYANSKSKTPGHIEVKPTDVGKNNVNSLLLNAHIPNNDKTVLYISPEMYTFMGYLIGDGHVEKRQEGGVGLSIGKQDITEVVEKVINPLIEQGWFTSYHKRRNGHDIRLCGTKGWKFLREHIYPNERKEIPTWIENAGEENIKCFLRGYFSADGSITHTSVSLSSINSSFIKVTNRLLKICGIGSNFWTEMTENSYNGKANGTYSRKLIVYNAVKFKEEIGFVQDRKQGNVRDSYSTRTKHMEDQSGYVLITPTKIEEIEYNDYVYDIEVDDTHTFYANDILVHNTDSTYFKTYADDSQHAIQVADAVGEIVNKSFPEYMRKTFLCTDDYAKLIKCGRENVSDRGIYVDKKMYILHIVDSEGEAVDYMKVMGLRTKKTTLPKEIAKKLNHFIELYLKGTPWEEIEKLIVEYKDELMNVEDVMRIGLPTGIKQIDTHMSNYRLDPAVHLPGHAAASVHYLKCLEDYNDHESMKIINGSKIKVFNLTRKHGRFNSIAIPVDIEQVPEWFLRDFEVDRKLHIKKLVDKALENILRAIEKVPPSKQKLLADELLGF